MQSSKPILKVSTNELYNDFLKNAKLIDEDLNDDCSYAKQLKNDYDYWQRNVMNKEAQMQLRDSLNKWKTK